MKWFEGSISEAVMSAKSKKAIFVVYVQGSNEGSTKMTEALNSQEITNKLDPTKFVCIKIQENTPEHKQFGEIYPLVPVPSVFFIGHNGEPLEIVVEHPTISSEAKITSGIDTCVNYLQRSGFTAGDVNRTSSSSQPMEKEKIEPDAKAPPAEMPSQDNPPEEAEGMSVEERIERAKLLVARKNELKRQEEIQKEKQAELERRRIGQELQKANKLKQDLELKQMKEEREKEKKEEADAKKRILDQIAQDRAERAERLAMSQGNAPPTTAAPPPAVIPPPASNSNIARLQFKLPSGEVKTHTFPSDTTLSQVRQFIDNNIVLPFSEYQMATMFPRREFTHRDNNSDLSSLGLLPSATILIRPVSGSTVRVNSGPSWYQVCKDMFWDMIQPLFTVSRYVQSYLFGGPRPEDRPSGSVNRPGNPRTLNAGTGVRRRGNIHTLADDSDTNDENNTWNGNSTQQISTGGYLSSDKILDYIKYMQLIALALFIWKLVFGKDEKDECCSRTSIDPVVTK